MLQAYKSLKKLILPTVLTQDQDQAQAKPRLVTPLLRISIYLIVRLCQLRCQWHWFQCKRCECKHQALIQIFLKDLYQVIFYSQILTLLHFSLKMRLSHFIEFDLIFKVVSHYIGFYLSRCVIASHFIENITRRQNSCDITNCRIVALSQCRIICRPFILGFLGHF